MEAIYPKGTDQELLVTVYASDGETPADLDDFDNIAYFIYYNGAYDTELLKWALSTTLTGFKDLTIEDAANGQFSIKIDSEDSENWRVGQNIYGVVKTWTTDAEYEDNERANESIPSFVFKITQTSASQYNEI